MEAEWVVLDIFENGTQAEIVKGYLQENGIIANVRSSTVPYGGSAIFGESGPKELLVKAEDLEKAQELIEEVKKENDKNNDDLPE